MTIPDLVVLGLLLSTSLLGLSRGLVRAVFYPVAWVVGVGVTPTLRRPPEEYYGHVFHLPSRHSTRFSPC
ncbi:MAG: CvpA family protein, partial [Alphaproteobacteria bacterium]|nr:CvpA family protein [Alphaproteobacteria bacterium]